MIGEILRDLPPVDVGTRRFWGGALGLLRWRLLRGRGRKTLTKFLNDGLPICLREPIEFLIDPRLGEADRAVRERIEALRRQMLARGGENVEAWNTRTPASGSPAGLPDVVPGLVTLGHVAAVGSISPYWGSFLQLCAKSLPARVGLELGGCAGISGCYLAAASDVTWFATVEGSPALSRLAASHLAEIQPRARVWNRGFDETLDEILPALPAPLDLVFIDGEHTRRGVLRYTERLAPAVRHGGLLILDDIHWSLEMEEAWHELRSAGGFACSLDLGRIGLLVRGADGQSPNVFDFSRHTAFWRRGAP